MSLTLQDGWTVRAVGGDVPARILGARIPATVPGCVHLDLVKAGLIADPYLDENERAAAWVGRVDWAYETTFDWNDIASSGVVELVALGLDTVATIELNGSVVARTANMHRSYRFGVGHLLRHGSNTLSITFVAGLTAAEQEGEVLGPRPHVNAHPFNAIRKMACNFGWDWGPDLVTAGIWRPLSLQTWRSARIDAVRPLIEVDGTAGIVRAHVNVQHASGYQGPLRVDVEIDGRRSTALLGMGETTAVVEITVPEARLWWPHGYGDQPLYPVVVDLLEDQAVLDSWTGRVGFRTITLDTSPDEHGTPFALHVNGVPLFARGVNWIPEDSFPCRVDRERYSARLSQARDANINLIRVWGGGIYESEDFYALCDELGLLVWQDFLFACAAYAEEEPLRGEVIAEAREAITRLSAHTSLALWNGCNENIWGHEDWGWKQDLGDRTWGWGYYTEVLPGLLAELDPTRPYSPGSPYSMSPERHPNDPDHGTMHIWDVWNQLDYTHYRDYVPRFCSEFGFQGPPTWTTLTRAIHDEPLSPDSPAMLVHQKAEDGNAKLANGLNGHLPAPQSMADWHWATSLNQARAIAFGIEHFRSWTPICRGAVLWQFNDCWPVTSWAAVDGDGRLKPLWYAVRRAFADRLLTVQPRDGGLAVIAVNDASQRWDSVLEVSRFSIDGAVLASFSVPFDVPPRESVTIALPIRIVGADDPSVELLAVSAGAERAWWHFAEDVDSALPAPDLEITAEQYEGGYRFAVTARTYVRDLAIMADRLADDAVVDNMLVTLLPGESTTFEVRTAATLGADALQDPLVLRSANDLMAIAKRVITGA